MGKQDTTAVDYAALAELRFAIRKFLAFSEEAATAAGLTPQQHQALLVIRGFGGEDGLPVGAVADRLLLRKHTAVELIDRLERAELVDRTSDPNDRRRVIIRLSPKGVERLATLSSAHLRELRGIGPALLTAIKSLAM